MSRRTCAQAILFGESHSTIVHGTFQEHITLGVAALDQLQLAYLLLVVPVGNQFVLPALAGYCLGRDGADPLRYGCGIPSDTSESALWT